MSNDQRPETTVTTTLDEFPQYATAIIEATDREYWEPKHRLLVRLDNYICRIFKFSRSGMVRGKVVPIKALRTMVDNVP